MTVTRETGLTGPALGGRPLPPLLARHFCSSLQAWQQLLIRAQAGSQVIPPVRLQAKAALALCATCCHQLVCDNCLQCMTK